MTLAPVPGLTRELMPEGNPVPVVVPKVDVSAELHGFLTELTTVARNTHEQNQLGDPTFNWQMMLAVEDVASRTLGSQGSFYHPTYGAFQGIYVRFDSMDANAIIGGPVGFTKNLWTVTNQLSKTFDGGCRGLLCSASIPLAGQFGWILTQGVSFNQLTVDTAVQVKDMLGWTVDGLVVSVNSNPVGQVTVIAAGVIPPGGFTLALGPVPANLSGRTQSLETRIAELETTIQELQTTGVNNAVTAALAAFQESMAPQFATLGRRISQIADDRSDIQETQFLQSLTNLSNSAGLSRTQALLAARLGATQLNAAVQFVKEARTGRDASKYYSEASGNFSVEAGLSAANAFESASASAGFSANASTFADAAGVSASASATSAAAASVSEGNAAGSATSSATYAANASTSESNAYAYSLVAASNQIDLTTLTATVTTQASAITDIQGKQEAWWEVDAIAGDNTASLSLHADNSGGRIHIVAGEIDLDGDVVINGSLTTPKFANSSVSQTYFYIGSSPVVVPHA